MQQFLKQNIIIITLVIIGFVLRLFFAHLDPYLHEWDERFHALVAKNLMDNPLKPLLHKNAIIPFDKNSWWCNTIWLHKQPLFMWQMALSMKIFGVTEYAIRYPSVLMGTIMIVLTYRISLLWTGNKLSSLLAAALCCFSNYQLELISGLIGMDHNDMAFCFYILLSIWAYIEYVHSINKYWIIAIGIFSGFAILNKWLVGLLIFLPWGIHAIMQLWRLKKLNEFKYLLLALIFCILVFAPWQIYILSQHHDIAVFEYQYNTKHLFEAVEGHSGGFNYYLLQFPRYFGKYLFYLIPISIGLCFLKKENYQSKITLALITCFMAVFIFFSFVVTSKLPSYFFIVAPIGFILIANAIVVIFKYIPDKNLQIPISFVILYLSLNPYNSYSIRKNNEQRDRLIYNTKIYKQLKHIIPDTYSTITNIPSHEDIDVMFYNKHINAYHYCIEDKDLEALAKKKIKLAVFKDHGKYKLSNTCKTYPHLFLIDTLLK